MADNKVTITYGTEYDGKGAKTAQEDLKKTASQAQKTGQAAAEAGEQGNTGFSNMAVGIGKAVAAFAAIKGVIDFFASSVQAANENARAVNTLAAAYNAVGYTAQGAMKQAQDFATKMQSLTGIADEAFLNAQRLLANYGVVGAKAQEAIQAAYALSIGRSIDFGTAMDIVSKAAAGQTQTLARYGIQIDKNTESGAKFDAVLAQINERFGATAQAAMGDSTTKLNALKESWGDFKEQVGAGLNDGLVPAVDFLTKAVGWLNQAFKSLGAIFGIVFDQAMIGVKQFEAGLVATGEYALKAFQPLVTLMGYLPGVGSTIKEAYDGAVASMEQTYNSISGQIEALEEMRTPLSAIWETEKAITDEQQARLDLQAEEINNRVANEQAAQEQLTEVVRQGVEERKQLQDEATAEETEKKTDLFGLSALLNKQETQDKKKTFADITNMLRTGSKEQMAVQKAQGMAQAAISAYQAANSAYAALAPIPIIGPALGAAAAAAAIAYGLGNVAQISGIKLAEGGLVKAVTGGVPAVIGEGGSDEAVLPLDDSQAMRRIGGAIAEQSGGAMGGVVVNINVQATGGVEAILEQLTDAARTGTVQALEFANINYKNGQEQQGYSV
jgi:hypothetical protein